MARSSGPFSDSALAEQAYEEALRDRFAHVRGLGWLAWDGKVWREVAATRALEALRVWARDHFEAAAARAATLNADPDADLRDVASAGKQRKAWYALQFYGRLSSVLKLCVNLCAVDPEQLDANPDVLNCQNGIVHLPTADLLPHNPRMWCTKIAGADYVPTALHADWTAALAAVPPDVEPWLQIRYGQAITGHTSPDDLLMIQQGEGANGKSTILMGVDRALGDYYYAASDKVLMGSHSTAHTTDLADLRGTRFVSIEELPEIGRLDAARLKKLVGTERITARKMRQDNVVFNATHTLFVNTNYPPMVAETDDGTWRRLVLVVFPYRFCENPSQPHERKGDRDLRARLRHGKEQREAALAWLVEGAQRWYEANRVMPDLPVTVQLETDAWHGRTDHVAAFFGDHLDVDPNAYVYAGDMIWLFNQYMRQHGNAALAEGTFIRRFSTHELVKGAGIEKRRIRQGVGQKLQPSRPFGALDPFSRLPGVPTGQIQAWVGVRFRTSGDQIWTGEQDHTKGRDS